MFVINPLPPQIDPALIELLVKAEPATIGHFLEFGFMDPGIRALLPDLNGTNQRLREILAKQAGTKS